MDFPGAVQWWDEWQLCVLVLSSLFLQYLLFLSLGYTGGMLWRYIALATLFNRHKKQEHLTTSMEVLWAPVLLIHLAGQHLMTAYDIKDNELWRGDKPSAHHHARLVLCFGRR
ncbi:hypothetical protein VPH35_139361 [Triticum aestivum]